MKKYEFTGETKEFLGIIVKRIKRISDGKLGGWIEKEENLSHDETCWVYGDAWVYGNAQVYENAQVYGDARVSKSPINIIGLSHNITITDNHMSVGCQIKTHAEWKAITETEAKALDSSGLDFYRYFKHTLISLMEYHTR